MNRALTAIILAASMAVCGGCSQGERQSAPSPGGQRPAPAAPVHAEPANTTPNQFFTKGVPSFVVGTGAGPVQSRRIAAQVSLLRGQVFPNAPVITDTAIDLGKGPAAWPSRPVVYGAAHENALIAHVRETLPFELTAKSVVIGGHRFEGPGIRLVTVVPARSPKRQRVGHPEFLLYAGTGDAGVAEINAGLPLGASILVADTFGPLATGRWATDAQGGVRAEMKQPFARRIKYRERRVALQGADAAKKSAVRFWFPAMVPEHADEDAVIAACVRGLRRVVERLHINDVEPLSVYVYPDRRSKAQLSGNRGDGHAVPSSRSLHVLVSDPAEDGPLESLVAHEATHVLGYFAWGPAATPLMGEGLAVWVSGTYAGKTVEQWTAEMDPSRTIESLLGPGWRSLDERVKYPFAGAVVAAAMEAVGADKVRDHLLGASADSWGEASAQAGTSREALGSALARRISARRVAR